MARCAAEEAAGQPARELGKDEKHDQEEGLIMADVSRPARRGPGLTNFQRSRLAELERKSAKGGVPITGPERSELTAFSFVGRPEEQARAQKVLDRLSGWRP